jgi:hypothetical protein
MNLELEFDDWVLFCRLLTWKIEELLKPYPKRINALFSPGTVIPYRLKTCVLCNPVHVILMPE